MCVHQCILYIGHNLTSTMHKIIVPLLYISQFFVPVVKY